MPAHVPNRWLCRNCDGHASVMATTGGRNRDGSRTLLPVLCPACKGTGRIFPAPAMAPAGR